MQTQRMVMLAAVIACIPVVSSAAPASNKVVSTLVRQRLQAASPIAKAAFNSVKQKLTFSDEGRTVALVTYNLPVAITDTDGSSATVQRILLDPTYIDPSHGPDDFDFFLEIRGVKKVGSTKSFTSFASCKWQKGKAKAICGVEEGDSSYELSVVARGATLKASRFNIIVGRKGFAIATYENTDGAAAIMVRPKGHSPVNVSLSFN